MKTRTCTNPSPARDRTERSRRSREAGAAPQPAAILGSACTGSGAPSGVRLPAAEAQLDRRRSVLSPVMKTVFVTVGTTSFDELIAAVSSPAAEQVRRRNARFGGRQEEGPSPPLAAGLPCLSSAPARWLRGRLWGAARSCTEGGKREPFCGEWEAVEGEPAVLSSGLSPASVPPPQVLRSRGCRQLVLQIGRGALQPAPQYGPAFVRDVFRFKESLAEDLRRADLVISHAGEAWRVAEVCFWEQAGRLVVARAVRHRAELALDARVHS